MYLCTKEYEKLFKNDTYVTIALETVKNYMAELFVTESIGDITEKEFFDFWSSKTPVERRIRRTKSFEEFVRKHGIVVILDDELIDLIAEGATKALKTLYDTTKPTT